MLSLATSSPSGAQVVIPSEKIVISISSDKSTYNFLSPVIIKVSVTNISTYSLDVGHIHPFGKISYTLYGPGGDALEPYELYRELISVPMNSIFSPGETRVEYIDLLQAMPASIEPGIYKLQVEYISDSGPNAVPSTLTYVVLPAQSEAMSKLARAAESVWRAEAWLPVPPIDPDPILEDILAEDIPLYAMELAAYLYALSADVKARTPFGRTTVDEMEERYAQFIESYPKSIYANVLNKSRPFIIPNTFISDRIPFPEQK